MHNRLYEFVRLKLNLDLTKIFILVFLYYTSFLIFPCHWHGGKKYGVNNFNFSALQLSLTNLHFTPIMFAGRIYNILWNLYIPIP